MSLVTLNTTIILHLPLLLLLLSSVPAVLEYMSYCFNFHSVLAGPSVTMREHLDFMDGSNFLTDSSHQSTTTKVGGYGVVFGVVVLCCVGVLNTLASVQQLRREYR